MTERVAVRLAVDAEAWRHLAASVATSMADELRSLAAGEPPAVAARLREVAAATEAGMIRLLYDDDGGDP